MKRDKIQETDLWAYISKTASTAVKDKVERWIDSKEYDAKLFEKIKRIHDITGENPSVAVSDIAIKKNDLFKKIAAKESNKRKQRFKKLVFRYAAAAVIVLSTSFFAYFITQPEQIYIATTYGEQKEVLLSDGSVIWLNASSKISYKENSPRTIHLEGEAFFEVAKDKTRPFTVETPDNIIVKALGTSFNIKAYPNSSYSETVLLTGKVEVSLENSVEKSLRNKIIMLPTDKIRVLRNKQVLRSTIKNKMNIVSWKSGKIHFKNKTFKEIAEDFKNQYNLKIHFENEEVANVRFTGVFSKTMPIEEILKILTITKSFNYEFNSLENSWLIK